MATTVNILCPNGRRFNIKVSSNDTVMQVLEKVCLKGNFNASEYDLRHQRNILDVTVPFRYANIPNLAKLEMVKLSKPRGDSKVHIALQVESGERLTSDFKSDINLLAVLSHWDSVNQSLGLSAVKVQDDQILHPVCIYMRREIIGEAWLKHTSLKSLGLTRGKAVIRHMHRATELPSPPKQPVKQRQPSSQIQTSIPSNENIPTTTNKVEQDRNIELRTEAERTVGEEEALVEQMDTTDPDGEKMDTNKVPERISQDQLMEVEEIMTDSTQSDKQTGDVGMDEQLAAGARPKSHIRESVPSASGTGVSNVTMDTQHSQTTPSIDSFLQSHGAAVVELDQRTRERMEQLMKKEEEMMQQMTEVAQQLRSQKMATAITQPATTPLHDFKFPDSSEKPVTTTKESASETEDCSKPCDRKVLVFKSTDALPSGEQFQELPDNFFDVTAKDMKAVLADLKDKQASDRPLETKSMKEARTKKQMSKYSKVTVRIHFPDHLIMQAFFKPQEKVEALYNFVEKCLHGKDEFHLYTTPPKNILKDKNQNLFEAKLFPAAVVYFGSPKSQGQILSEKTLQKQVSLVEADATVFEARPSTSSSESSSFDPSSGPSQSKRKPPSGSSEATGSSTSQGQAPKWFKMGKR